MHTLFLSDLNSSVFPPPHQKGETFLYLHRLNPSSLQKYRLERAEPGLLLLSCSASYQDKHIRLVYLCESLALEQLPVARLSH